MFNKEELEVLINNQRTMLDESLFHHSWVSPKHKYIYITTPKVACTKIKITLQKLEGYPIPDEVGQIHHRNLPNHKFLPKLTDYSTEQGVEILMSSDWYRFGFVRNPYDRLFSAYKSKIMYPDPVYRRIRNHIRNIFHYPIGEDGTPPTVCFKDFVHYVREMTNNQRDLHWRTQSSILINEGISYDLIGRLENFQDDFAPILRRCKAPQELFDELGIAINPTARISLAAAYNTELADTVFHLYKDDFENFAYDRNSWMFEI